MTDTLIRKALEAGKTCCEMLVREGGAAATELSEEELPLINKALQMVYADKPSEISDVVTVRAVIDDMPHVAGEGVKFKLRYLEYENDELACSTGPLDLVDVMATKPVSVSLEKCVEAVRGWFRDTYPIYDSDLELFAKAVLDAAGVVYHE